MPGSSRRSNQSRSSASGSNYYRDRRNSPYQIPSQASHGHPRFPIPSPASVPYGFGTTETSSNQDLDSYQAGPTGLNSNRNRDGYEPSQTSVGPGHRPNSQPASSPAHPPYSENSPGRCSETVEGWLDEWDDFQDAYEVSEDGSVEEIPREEIPRNLPNERIMYATPQGVVVPSYTGVPAPEGTPLSRPPARRGTPFTHNPPTPPIPNSVNEPHQNGTNLDGNRNARNLPGQEHRRSAGGRHGDNNGNNPAVAINIHPTYLDHQQNHNAYYPRRAPPVFPTIRIPCFGRVDAYGRRRQFEFHDPLRTRVTVAYAAQEHSCGHEDAFRPGDAWICRRCRIIICPLCSSRN